MICFVKLVRRREGADVVVRGARGQVRTLLTTVPRRLPRSGCATAAGHTYAVQSFPEKCFTGEPVTVYVLIAA